MLAYIHSTETFGTVDGPGIRYVLFMSGCSLACGFCHNRDTWELSDKRMSVEQVLAEYDRYRAYYDAAGGGITVSGGEPLLQPEFVAELLAACKQQGIHTILETAGNVSGKAFESVLPYTDGILFGVKAADPVLHKALTGVTNEVILSNLASVVAAVPVTVRYVIIPGVNSSQHQLEGLAALLQALVRQPPVELLSYHKLGQYKWDSMGMTYPLAEVREASSDDMELARSILSKQGITVMQ